MSQSQEYRGKGTRSPIGRERVDAWESHDHEYETGREHYLPKKYSDEAAYNPHTLPKPQTIERLEDLSSK